MAPLESFRWESLLDDVKIRVASFLPCRERARVSKTSRSISKACWMATVRHPHITNATMPDDIGRPLDEILNILRYAVYRLGLSGSLSSRATSILHYEGARVDKLLFQGLHEDVTSLTCRIFTYWETDLSGLPDSGVLNYLTQHSVECNPYLKLEDHLLQVQHWPQSRVQGAVYVFFERPDGTVMVAADTKKVYLTQGFKSSIGELVWTGKRLPRYTMITLLPFHGYISFNGYIAGSSIPVSAEMCQQLYQTYCEAVDNGTLITSLPLQPPPPHTFGLGATPTAAEAPELSPGQQLLLQRIQQLPKPADSPTGDIWVFQLRGHTEEENPGHLIALGSFKGYSFLPGTFLPVKSLQPTALELFDLFCLALFSDGIEYLESGSVYDCPGEICVDERTALFSPQALLKPTGIVVQYYPPSTPEEDFCTNNVGGCASCHIKSDTLRLWGRPPLSQCQRCKKTQYCSRECQRLDWKLHKHECKPAPK